MKNIFVLATFVLLWFGAFAQQKAATKPSGIGQLTLLNFETGYYGYVDLNGQRLYQPMVIMKWKNISKEPLTKSIEIRGTFVDNKEGEEWDNTSANLQGFSDTPLQPNISRQVSLRSNVGFVSIAGIVDADISCMVFINNKLYKTIKIQNKELTSNRMQ